MKREDDVKAPESGIDKRTPVDLPRVPELSALIRSEWPMRIVSRNHEAEVL